MTTLSRLSLTASVLCMLAAPLLATGARAESKAMGSVTPVATQAAGAQTPANGKAAPEAKGKAAPEAKGKAAPEAKGKVSATHTGTTQAGTIQAGGAASSGTPATTVR